MGATLTVEDLHVRFQNGSDPVYAVNGASFELRAGETVGLVGESGCGKSVTARSIVGLEEPGEIVEGSIEFDGIETTTADDRTRRRLRARALALVFQDPSTALNPVYTVGEQIAEAIRASRRVGGQSILEELATSVRSRLRTRRTRQRVLELLETVGIPRPEALIDAYPHQCSGGMRQRILLAIALARRPEILIADEPTTGLDTTTQRAVLDRLEALTDATEMGVLLISHDFGVVAERCDRVLVMYDGDIVERGPVDSIRSNPAHPYTKTLLGCLPGRSDPRVFDRSDPGSRPSMSSGSPSDRSAPPSGCVFADRCSFARSTCRERSQPTVAVGGERSSRLESDAHTVRCGVREAREATLESMPTRDPTRSTDGLDANGSSRERGSDPKPMVDGGSTVRRRRVDAEASIESATSAPNASGPSGERSDRPLIELEDVRKRFRRSESLVDRLPWLGADDPIRAVRGVSLELSSGETLGLVGESGCGKSTLARLVTGIEVPTAGAVRLRGEAVGGVDSRTNDQLAEIGTVFQNPGASLNPKRTVGQSIAEPLIEAGWDDARRADRVDEVLSLVALSPDLANRYPRQLSGGQRQRVAIARALAPEPSVLVLDEPTAALDPSTQATILSLLADLQDRLEIAYLFVSHDLAVVRTVADRVATMYLGRFVEVGPVDRTMSDPTHPYTQALLDASPRLSASDGSDDRRLAGDPPDPSAPPEGCAFHPRCPAATEECTRVDPSLEATGDSKSRCLYAPDWTATDQRSNTDRAGRSNDANSK
ncbi:dipeptide ABC transporter ATP-binding protein [Halostagnicola kamekurae]|uniref:Peptide/nickel transport system ATP-binding protein n=1 Tax=Halostagnicola kamekurae TaxID=619731 RepID=A0A1I6SUY1_9EURY|nr:ABC transporter ATP-binding protein [Halostagnicola kamekurae]SFS80741.1 peptide/nickel transport system ATP-binding protein [Halostagnicola kamekurae]